MAGRLIGRDAELAALRDEIEAAAREGGRAFLLVGEAGIGKTRLAMALAAEARASGFLPVWGRCREGEGAPVYWPWVQAIRSSLADRSGPAAAELQDVLSELRTQDAGESGSQAHARFALFDRVTSALGAAARDRPLLIVLDDLHWADVGSLRLLEFLAPELSAAPVVVLGTLRETDAMSRPDAAALLAGLMRSARRITLSGLAQQAVRDLLADRLGGEPRAELVEHVLQVTGGNPFLLLEVADVLAADAGAASDVSRLSTPLTIGARGLLRRRAGALPPESFPVLHAAAVMGHDFDVDTLALALGRSPEAILDALDPALRHGVVRQVTDMLGRYAFVHALIREAIYEDLPPARRTGLHAAIAGALETRGAATDDRLPLLASHAFEGAQAGDAPRALRHQLAAGTRASRLLAFEEAVRFFERALSMTAIHPDDTARLQGLTGLGEALHHCGAAARSQAALADAVELARAQGAETFAETVRRVGDVRLETGRLDVATNTLLEEALAALPPEPTPLRARLSARLAAGLLLQPGAQERRKAMANEATAMARTLGDRACLEFVLSRRLVALLGPDTLAARIATADELLRTRPASRAAELEAIIFRIDDLAERGDRAGLDHALTTFDQTVGAYRHPFFVWAAHCFRAGIALFEGRFAEGDALAQEAFTLGQRAHAPTAMLAYAQQVFLLRGWQARLSEVEPLFSAGVAETAIVPAWRCGLASLYQLLGREADARRELDALAQAGLANVPRDAAWLTAMSLLAGLCVRLGDAARAATLYDLMLPFADRIAGARPLVVLVGPIANHLGALATLLERWEDAERHFGTALALAERMRALPWQAEVRHQWGVMHLRRGVRGDHECAGQLLDEAEAIAQPLGMQLLLQWIGEARRMMRRPERAAARAVGDGVVLSLVPRPNGSAPPLEARRAAPPGNTFRREGDVWTIVFEGRTTRLRHMIGLTHLATLLRQPGHAVHVGDLIDSAYETRRDAPPAARPTGDAGELLDRQARAEYQARLRAVREEHDEAVRLRDHGRADRLSEEMEFLTAELTRGFGLAGRPRRAGSAQERARIAVVRAIKYATDKIAEHDRPLAEHLRLGVRTGTLCSYAPPSRDTVAWTL
jgi:tetratricopeptide (TPR) repeat protein